MITDILKVTNVADFIEKYSVSWLTTMGITLATPTIDLYLPLLFQIILIIVTQLIAVGIDFLRNFFLKQRTKTNIEIVDNKIELTTEILEKKDNEVL